MYQMQHEDMDMLLISCYCESGYNDTIAKRSQRKQEAGYPE